MWFDENRKSSIIRFLIDKTSLGKNIKAKMVSVKTLKQKWVEIILIMKKN